MRPRGAVEVRDQLLVAHGKERELVEELSVLRRAGWAAHVAFQLQTLETLELGRSAVELFVLEGRRCGLGWEMNVWHLSFGELKLLLLLLYSGVFFLFPTAFAFLAGSSAFLTAIPRKQRFRVWCA